jgi:CRP/FNR family cyclic AMP-dependent transcriptional regulator
MHVEMVDSPIRGEDPLDYLPASRTIKFEKGQTIYDTDEPSDELYLVVSGRVKLAKFAENRPAAVDICLPNELFGESALADENHGSEQAVALEDTQAMSWPIAEIENLILRRPRLGLALLQVVTKRNLELARQLGSFSRENIPRRLVRALLRFCDRMGVLQADGSVSMEPVTHELLAQCIGTSREIVTHHMTRFRRKGYLTYSRRSLVCRRELLEEWLAADKSRVAGVAAEYSDVDLSVVSHRHETVAAMMIPA